MDRAVRLEKDGSDQRGPPCFMTERELVALTEGAKIIALNREKFAIVDAEDYDDLAQFKWFAIQPNKKHPTFYAVRNGVMRKRVKGSAELMHRRVFGPTKLHVDHKNGDSLDNRRANL